MRAAHVVAIAVLTACGGSDEPAPAPVPVPPPQPAPAPKPPGLRLPEGVTPRAYDVRLEIDPATPTFRGHVAITTTLAARTDVIWLHAVGLELESAAVHDGAYTGTLTKLAGTEDMIGLRLDRPAGPGEIVLDLAYNGVIGSKVEGLFREQSNKQWFVYSQSESVFARRLVPCFDEPRFKPRWRTTLVVPRGDVALANAPVEHEQVLPDGRREVAFAEIGPVPSYLLAIAVGPFALVDVGRVGRANIPARIAVPPEDAKRVATALRALPEVVAALERYMDRPLPWPKLDLVSVPWFFGGMENIGLVTISRPFLVEGGPRSGRAEFVKLVAHELAHQWFGNTVTHAWWDELWLTESISELVGAHVARELGVRAVEARGDDDDDDEPQRALRQPIAVTDDIEGTFGATAYARGHHVLAMFERFTGETAMRDALRAYVTAHAGGSVTVHDLASALAKQSSPAVGDALTSVAEHVGAPVVELTLVCDAAPHLVAHVHDGVSLPICVRVERGAKPVCALAGDRTEVALPGPRCPTWLLGNAGGAGAYRVVYAGDATGAIASATPPELQALAADAVAALDTSATPAVRWLSAFARDGRPAATLAALSIARALDPLVVDGERAVWSAWLARQLHAPLADARLLGARSPFAAVLTLLPDRVADPIMRRAHALVDRAFGPSGAASTWRDLAPAFTIAARDPALFERALAFARDTRSTALIARRRVLADDVLAHLHVFGATFAPRLVDAALDPRLPAAALARSLAGLLERPSSAAATWRALAPRLAAIVARLDPDVAGEVLEATGSLCDVSARAEVNAAFTPLLAKVEDGTATLAHALAAIDRCVARRAAVGSVARALP